MNVEFWKLLHIFHSILLFLACFCFSITLLIECHVFNGNVKLEMPEIFYRLEFSVINCATLSAIRSEFTVSENKLKTIPRSILGCLGGFYIVKPNAKKPPNFLNVSANLVGTSSRQCYSSKMSSYMKSSRSCSYY